MVRLRAPRIHRPTRDEPHRDFTHPCLPLALVALAHLADAGQTSAHSSPRESITRADLLRAAAFLASDELGGRSTGSPGAERAANWLAAELQRVGLQPGGDDGTFLQRVPLARSRFEAEPELVAGTIAGERVVLRYGIDFDQVEAGVDAQVERILRVQSTAELPAALEPGTALLLPSKSSERRALLKRLGAAETPPVLLLVEGPDSVGKEGRGLGEGRLQVDPGASSVSAARLRLRGPILARVLAGEVRTLEWRSHWKRESVPAWNVVGVLRGVPAAKTGSSADQAVVFSAHYDHIGHRNQAPEGADTIFNGADDDASGCAAVLELAQAFAQRPAPARTLVFFLATGEEVGLLGTNWYLDHPLVPLERTLLNLNFEMIGRPDTALGASGKQWLTGFERSNLGPLWKESGLEIFPDSRPEQHFFERSDNYAFALRGVVAQTLSTFDAEKHGDYHGVDDEVDRLDPAHMEACVRTAFDAVLPIVDGQVLPAWSPGGAPKGR